MMIFFKNKIKPKSHLKWKFLIFYLKWWNNFSGFPLIWNASENNMEHIIFYRTKYADGMWVPQSKCVCVCTLAHTYAPTQLSFYPLNRISTTFFFMFFSTDILGLLATCFPICLVDIINSIYFPVTCLFLFQLKEVLISEQWCLVDKTVIACENFFWGGG